MVDFPNPIVRAKNGSFTKADTFLENELLSGEAIALSLVNKSELCVHDIVTGIYIFVVKFLIHCSHLKKKNKKGHLITYMIFHQWLCVYILFKMTC